MLDKLRSLMSGADAPTESDSERDGFLSYSVEFHALAIGMYAGFLDFKDWDGLDQKARENPSVRQEMAYAHGGYVIGAVVRTLIVAGASIFVVAN